MSFLNNRLHLTTDNWIQIWTLYCNCNWNSFFSFATEYILQIHVKNRHYKPVNVCHVCAKEIHDKQAFEKHVRSHFETSGPRIKCPREGCERWLKDKDNLRQHLRRFHDTKQYKCPQCERICKNKHSLTCHLNFTHNTQEYTCEECHKNFKSQQTLKVF